jgi:hypothetical protein
MILRKASDNAKKKTVGEAKLIVSATRCLGYNGADFAVKCTEGAMRVNIASRSQRARPRRGSCACYPPRVDRILPRSGYTK